MSAVPAVTERAYELFGPLTVVDAPSAAGRRLVLSLLAGLTAGDAEVWALAEDPGLATYLATDNAPEAWLPLLESSNGARTTGGMTTAQRRGEVSNPTGRRRELPASLFEVAAEYLTPGATPRLRERTSLDLVGDQKAHVTIQVRSFDVLPGKLDEFRVRFNAAVPIGMYGHVLVADLTTYDDVADDYANYDAVAAANASYSDLLTP